MRRLCAVVGLLAILVLGVPAVAAAGEVNVTYTVREAGLLSVPVRENAGPDFVAASSRLFDRRNRRRVGDAAIVCTFPAESRTPRCVSTLYLERGAINLRGDLTQPRFRFRVTGGLGVYANATGTARGTIINPRERDRFRARVRLALTLRGVQ